MAASFVSGLTVGLTGRIVYSSGVSVLPRMSVNHSVTSGGTGNTLGNVAWGPYQSASMTASADTTIDLTSFTDLSNTAGKLMARIRQIIIKHESTSSASSIVVFGAASNGINPYSDATSKTLLPGESYIFDTQSTNGLVVDSTHKNFRYRNSDAVNAATWSVIIVGSST